jgi:O-antigen ligase
MPAHDDEVSTGELPGCDGWQVALSMPKSARYMRLFSSVLNLRDNILAFALKLRPAYFAALAAIIPFFGIFIHRGILLLVIIGALIGAAAIGLRHSWREMPPLVTAGMGIACLWALLSTFWAIDSEDAFIGATKLTGNAIASFVFLGAVMTLDRAHYRRIAEWLAVGWSIALAIMLVEVLFKGPIFKALYNYDYDALAIGPFWLTIGVGILTLTYWPAAIVLKRKIGWIGPALGLAGLAGVSTAVQFGSGQTALLISVPAAGLVYVVGRRCASLLAVLFIVVGLAAPFALVQLGDPPTAASTFESIPNSARHRLAIWNFTSHKIMEHPLRGWGMNAARDLPDGRMRIADLNGMDLGQAMPLHPHNMLLQIWLELGIVGVASYLSIAAFLLYRAARMTYAPPVIGFLMTAFAFGNLSFGIWQGWWLGALIAAGSVMIAASRYISDQAEGLDSESVPPLQA